MLENSININNFNCNPVLLKKKLVKPLKNTIFAPNSELAQSKKKKKIYRNNKPDHTLSKTFNFIKISYALTELWMFFYFVWCFLAKKGHFPAWAIIAQAVLYEIATSFFVAKN